MLSTQLILKAAVNIYATKGNTGITSGDKFCTCMEAYCKIPEAAQVGQVVYLVIKACSDSAKSKMLIDLICNFEYKVIPVEGGNTDRPSPHLAILDEVRQVRGPHDAFIEAIETAQGAHDDPLLIAISSQAAKDV